MQFGNNKIQDFDITRIRALYQSAPTVKSDALELGRSLLPVDSTSRPLLVCYKGASEMIMAKYMLNPLMKLERFNNGKYLIEKAISRDTLNIEMRFIRYSIQCNIPKFLNYNDAINRDKSMLMANIDNIRDHELKILVFNYLSNQSRLNKDKLKDLKN